MKNLKTLTALAAVMLAGLAAPNAAADFACTTNQDLGIGEQDVDRSLSSGGSYAYRIDATDVDVVILMEEKATGDNVKFSVWRLEANGDCDTDNGSPLTTGNEVDAIPPVGGVGAKEQFTLPQGAFYRVLIEDAESESTPSGETFSIAAL